MKMDQYSPELLKHFDLLKSLGVIEKFDENQKQIQTLETILTHAWEIFTKDSVESIIEYVKSCLDEMFIPENLVFIVRNQKNQENLQLFAYKNLKRVSCEMKLRSLDSFSPFFIKYPATINFSLFEYKLDNHDAISMLPEMDFELIVPIVGFSGLYGIILFGNKILGSEYTEFELKYIDKLMKLTSVAIQNTIHYQSSVRDMKTGLYNHSFFYSRLTEEASRADRYSKKYGLLILDIDHFKKFNDSYGHLAGDEILINIAHTLQDKLRKADIIARFGGEEFIILVPEANKINLFLAAERIRTAIEQMIVTYDNNELHITISVGGACYSQYNDVTPDELLSQADSALYTAKSKGRNYSCIFNPGFLFKSILYKYDKKDKNFLESYIK